MIPALRRHVKDNLLRDGCDLCDGSEFDGQPLHFNYLAELGFEKIIPDPVLSHVKLDQNRPGKLSAG